MSLAHRSFVAFSINVNRYIFEGDLDGALRLIGDYMKKNKLTASIETVVAIPLDDRTGGSPPSVQ
ncbi:MAG: hypothetical protein HPM95_05730 [Alphaproteobacteria bacterium]|nr:hypothetical protein [Alphaproteobacteria bacterium]